MTTQQQQEPLLKEFSELLEKTKTKRTLSNQKYDKKYYNDTFKPLLELGQFYEKKASDRIIKHFKLIRPTIEFNDTKEYDIKIDDVKYEVKTDIKAVKTNNIFIEFVALNKPSGISTTKAHYYIIVIPHKVPLYLLIEVSTLQTLINNKYFIKVFQPNEKNNYTGGYIFTVDTLISNSTLI